MSKTHSSPEIRLRGVRQNNLKDFDLDLPGRRLIVITGLSGSGKSSLAFDTLFAEGQRRYIETFSPYARQFFDRMDKPAVDSIEGIPPAIAIEQRNAVRSTRSTVGTMTEICDHMKVLWPHLARLHCRGCGQPVRKEPPRRVWETLIADSGKNSGLEVLVTFDLPLSEKLSLAESLALVAKQGYQRLLVNGRVVRIDDVGGVSIANSQSPIARSTTHNPQSTLLSPKSSTRNPQSAMECGQTPMGDRKASDVAGTSPQSAIRNPQSAIEGSALTVVQDRLKVSPANRARFVEACEQAYHFGKGRLVLWDVRSADSAANPRPFSNGLHCAACDIEYREPTASLFSFNHPVGACSSCKGFGRVIRIDYNLAVPDRSLTLAQGAVKPWRSGFSAECQGDLKKFCKATGVPMDVPINQLSQEHQRWVIEGEKDYGIDEEHEWPRAWYGVKGYFKWLETKSYKMHVRVMLSRYRAYATCPDCGGARLKPEALQYLLRIEETGNTSNNPDAPKLISLPDFYAMSVDRALKIIDAMGCRSLPIANCQSPSEERGKVSDASDVSKSAIEVSLSEVRSRLHYLQEVGLGYLTLDRATRTLSGGETERVNLTTCLGTRLVNTMFVLDEPSVGLHPRDTERLVRILQRLRDAGNTVIVVEHEASVMRAADQIVDLGPGHGESGGHIVFQGSFPELLKSPVSLTGQYLDGRRRIESPNRRPVVPGGKYLESGVRPSSGAETRPAKMALELFQAFNFKDVAVAEDGHTPLNRYSGNPPSPRLCIANATRHNLKDFAVEIPLSRLVCVTGVSGSGKTTLIREVLFPALQERLGSVADAAKASDRMETDDKDEEQESISDASAVRLTGWEHLRRAVMVDQSSLGKTPRSNPAVYISAFEDIREFFAQTDAARQRGLNASAFSFNSAQGQCERCRGAGFEKIEMQFLSDVYIRCPDCNGRRYRPHILEVKIRASPIANSQSPIDKSAIRNPKSEIGRSAMECSIADLLDATVDEAIRFLGAFAESRPAQRAVRSIKLLQELGLGYLRLGQPINTLSGGESQRLKLAAHLAETAASIPSGDAGQGAVDRTLFIFDEPTTGLHFDDIRVLLEAFQRLVDAGHSLLIVEHNLDVIKCADWVIDLGPEAGEGGGRLVAQGTPEDIMACEASHTGQYLREALHIQ